MFIDTLEFTIPVDLCNLYMTLQQQGTKSQLDFPASVNSYGTTQDANVQVALRANKVTFKVDGVSSNASIISKSECKTLKLSVFDVDRSLMPQNNANNSSGMSPVHQPQPVSNASKRLHEQSVSLPQPPAKSSRTSFSESSRPRSPLRRSQPQSSPRPSSNTQSKSHQNDTPVNVKQEPEDPDLIEIEPDHDPDDVVPKKETPYMQIDYSSDVPHTQTSQAALDRLSHPQSSHSQSPGSSSSSFHQNVPHAPDYAEPSTSQHVQGQYGDQSADEFLVFQDDNDYGDDNEADYSNDDNSFSFGSHQQLPTNSTTQDIWTYSQSLFRHSQLTYSRPVVPSGGSELSLRSVTERSGQGQGSGDAQSHIYQCEECGKTFTQQCNKKIHMKSVHQNAVYSCPCGKVYRYQRNLRRHISDGCSMAKM